jgi:inward rectifier potassium channel
MKTFRSPIKETLDPGFGTKYQQNAKRIINKDGTFNVIRKGVGISSRNIYQDLIKISWMRFFFATMLLIFSLNTIFSLIYMGIGMEDIDGEITGQGFFHNFSQAFYFSFQTFTTVGYGRISPIGDLSSFVAAIEAMVGLMCFALVTGLLYGRFSRPNISLEYSEKALIAPYKKGWALMFRIANRRQSLLMNMKASVSLTFQEDVNGEMVRKYFVLNLERDNILFFPLSWTIVHPIDEKSPFYEIDLNTISDYDLEIMIQIEGFDETFGNVVHSRYSYHSREIEVGAKYMPAYHTDKEGNVVLDVKDLHVFENVPFEKSEMENQK